MLATEASDVWKTRCFTFLQGNIACNDLHGTLLPIGTLERRVLIELTNNKLTIGELTALLRINETTVRSVVQRLLRQHLIVSGIRDESTTFRLLQVDIETCRQCNARCVYCPQSISSKPKGVMSSDVFSRVLSSVTNYRPRWVALNHFGEPLLDPLFEGRCQALRDNNLKLLLFTNGTHLTPAIVAVLIKQSVLHGVVFNFPSAQAQEWSQMMCLPLALFDQTQTHILHMAEVFEGSIAVLVNSATTSQGRRKLEIREMLRQFPHVSVTARSSHDRAGVIKNEHVLTMPTVKERFLSGCPRIASHLHVSWQGLVFLCCQDYDQRIVLGNLLEQSVEEIMEGPIAATLRSEIYGLTSAPANLICRGCSQLRRGRDLPG